MKTENMVWWMVLIRGIVLLLLGIFAVAWPNITLIIAAYIFALYILISGVINTIHGISGAAARRAWFLSLILGLAQIVVGIYVLRGPALTLAVFILVVGFTFLLQGILEVIVSFIEKTTSERVLDIVGGIFGILAGFFILRNPVTGGLAFVWVIGVYGIVVGAMAIAMALSLHAAFVSAESGNTRKRVAA
jgi:uncharacterized membrane protein HdeD (DUF308 family)